MENAPKCGAESEKVHRDAEGNDAGGSNGEEEFWTGEHDSQPIETWLNRS
jgi:hypothetical protein